MKLIDYLKERKIAAAAFGVEVGVPNRQTMSRYVRGERMPPPRVVLAVEEKTAGAVTWRDFATELVASQANA